MLESYALLIKILCFAYLFPFIFNQNNGSQCLRWMIWKNIANLVGTWETQQTFQEWTYVQTS